MIYRILADGVSIFDYDYPDMVVLDPLLETEVNTAGSLEFTMPAGHVFYESIHLLMTDIEVYEGEDLVWFGRPVEIKTDYYRQKSVYCEGALSFFNDSVQELNEYESISLHQFFKNVVETHNAQVLENRRFYVGKVTVPDKKVYRKLHYEQTLSVLKRQCLNAEGGYFFIRKEDGKNYIDWLEEMPYTCNQPIEFGLNLLTIGSNTGGGDIATCVLPLGKEDETTHKPLTVESVNKGSKIIESEAVKTYGRIVKSVSFDGVTDPGTLYQDGLEYLSSLQFDQISLECDASELHYLKNEYEVFRVGQMIHCISKPHLVDRMLPLRKMSLKLDTATKKITLGTADRQSLTEIYGEKASSLEDASMTEIQDSIQDIQDDLGDFKNEVSDYLEGNGKWEHWFGTQKEYDDLSGKNEKTIYFIYEEEAV